MAQKEKTIQPSKAEREQTEPYQKTRDIAADMIEDQIGLESQRNPSLNVPPNAKGDADRLIEGSDKRLIEGDKQKPGSGIPMGEGKEDPREGKEEHRNKEDRKEAKK